MSDGYMLKLIYSEKGTNLEEISNKVLTLLSKCQNHKEDGANFCGLLRKDEL